MLIQLYDITSRDHKEHSLCIKGWQDKYDNLKAHAIARRVYKTLNSDFRIIFYKSLISYEQILELITKENTFIGVKISQQVPQK